MDKSIKVVMESKVYRDILAEVGGRREKTLLPLAGKRKKNDRNGKRRETDRKNRRISATLAYSW